MGDTTGGPLYIGGDSAADEFVNDHAQTMDGTQVIESAVLAGPLTIAGTITVEGNLVIV
jgi:hypothetical protein